MNKWQFKSRKKADKAKMDRRESRLSFFTDMLFFVSIYFVLANIIFLILPYSGTMNISMIISGLFGCVIAIIPAYFIYKANVQKNYLKLDAQHIMILSDIDKFDDKLDDKFDVAGDMLDDKFTVATTALAGNINAIAMKNVDIYTKMDRIHEIAVEEKTKQKAARKNFTKDQKEIMDALSKMSTLGKELELLSAENAQIKDQLTVLQDDLHQEKEITKTLGAQITQLEKDAKEMERLVENLKNRNNILATNLVAVTGERDNYKRERDESNKKVDQLLLGSPNNDRSRND